MNIKYLPYIFLSTLIPLTCTSQPAAGTTGLMNTPTAEMQRDGTFVFGANYLPASINPEDLKYNTGNYYLNLTFLPFWEVNYRCTLLKINSSGKINQDRSFALRARLLRERKYLPALVFGANDVYTSSKGDGNQYFGSMYAVLGKTFKGSKNCLGSSLGYGFSAFRNKQLTGLFGGLSFSPGILPAVRIMAEYDSMVFNLGASVTIRNHFQILVFAYKLNTLGGGLAYKIYL